jgi:hypothetical protein
MARQPRPESRARLLEVFERAGQTADQALWRLFFIMCSESFGFAGGQEWMVSHYLSGRGADGASWSF